MAAPQLKEKPDLKLAQTAYQSSADHDEESSEPPIKKVIEEGEGPWLVSYADMMTLLMGFFALIASMSKIDQNKFEKVQETATQQFGGEFKKPYQDLADKIENIVKKNELSEKIKVSRQADGVIVKFDGTLFFTSGDYVVSEQGLQVINKLLLGIKDEIPSHKALIEGHTDNVPIHHEIIASNWELSGIRAARIAQVFEGYGFNKSQLTILGWGETKPEVPNFDGTGKPIPENQAKNRRVILKISRLNE